MLDPGFSLIELLVVLTLVAIVASVVVPVTATSIDANRARQAAGFVAARLRSAKLQAVSRSASVGLAFDQSAGRWTFRICADGNANGLKRAELGKADACDEGPFDIEA